MLLKKFVSPPLIAALFMATHSIMVVAGDTPSLPKKSEWLPGAIKRGADGKLNLSTPAKEALTPRKRRENTPQTNQALNIYPPPTPMSTKTLHKNSVTLNWSAPENDVEGKPLKGPIGYKIYYWKDGASQKTININERTQYTLSNLSFGSTYIFAITTYNGDGIESDYSEIISVKLEAPAVTP